MTKKLNQFNYNEDELDLYQIIKILFESKKIIVLSILLFFLLGFFYSNSLKPIVKSSVIIEIGYFEMNGGNTEIIEKPLTLVDDLKLNIALEKQAKESIHDISIKPLFDKFVLLEASSNSGEINNKNLNKFISYIIDRHSKIEKGVLYNTENDSLSNENNLINSPFSEYVLTIRKDTRDQIAELKINNKYIIKQITQLEKLVIDETSNLNLLLANPDAYIERSLSSPSLHQIIYSYKKQINELEKQKIDNERLIESLEIKLKNFQVNNIVSTKANSDAKTIIIKPENKLTIFLSIVVGLFFGIFYVFFRRLIIRSKETETKT